ncbi:TadE/TadG family type IV pilus assembly protein [Rhizorhapis suberifaciens]|uniref:Flp pilus assembly protein TadG n=1 Tax=Rhizorhapis suberifaciens TaxID=13656 RepID=A0A840HSR5_9SPHN|nr:TadE/TadG family type IV pilus assembly protein [Rhizorhapis suberifaciens]MBB4641212.1 Flp pilus assembly protein TadG [Rhizorhapis suberifaciens]
MKRLAFNLRGDRRGATAAEFALVLPLMLLFLLGILDVGRLMWTWNQAEKATQTGVRYAVATNVVANNLSGFSFATTGYGTQGDPVSTTAFTGMACTSTSCTCTGTACNSINTSLNNTAFTNLINRMNDIFPQIAAANVTVDYTNVGLGFAGDPNGPDVAPLVTVKLRNLTFQPITLLLFNTSITLPDFSAALTLEDGNGTYSN